MATKELPQSNMANTNPATASQFREVSADMADMVEKRWITV